MPLDRSQPVIVKKTIVTQGANVYPARATPYLPGEIPEAYFTEEYCTQQGVQFRPRVDATPEPVNLTREPENVQALKEVEIVEENAKPSININLASPEKIAAFIDGAGPKTVEALDKCRQEKPFQDIEDLMKRCPLPKTAGKTWETYKDAIEF